MHYKLAHLPLLKVLVPFITGMAFFSLFEIKWTTAFLPAAVMFCIAIISHFNVKTKRAKRINTAIIFTALLITGGCLYATKQRQNEWRHFSQYTGKFALGHVTLPLEEKAKTYKTIFEITSVLDSAGHVSRTSGKLLVYMQKDCIISTLVTGDEILFPLNPEEIAPPKNPGQFNYRQYLNHKSIYYQQYLSSKQVKLTAKYTSLMWKRWSYAIGNSAAKCLQEFIPTKEAFSIADGILLGHRANIDPELYNAFAYTGILHILSVSGLHVGIIYGMLLFVLRGIKDRNKRIRIFKFVITLLCIWLFTFVTGSSAACVRAAILFSFLNYGKLQKEYVNQVNLLCGAALVQLIIDPFILFDIGFQLSYLAMLGLFIFSRRINALFYHPNKLVSWTWSLWSASIAAQVFTVPLSIYYFGNFPVYFLFTNIFAIPLSAVILWLSIGVLATGLLPFIAKSLGWLDYLVISCFTRFTYFFSSLPYGKLYHLYISPIQLSILMAAMLVLTLAILWQKPKIVMLYLVLIAGTICISYSHEYHQLKKDELVFYTVPGKTVIGITNRNQQLLLSSATLSSKEKSFFIDGSQRIFRINDTKEYSFSKKIKDKNVIMEKNLIYAGNTSIYLMDKQHNRVKFKEKLNVDYLVLSGNCYLDINHLQQNFEAQKIVISTQNDKRHIVIYRKILKDNGINFADINEEALVLTI